LDTSKSIQKSFPIERRLVWEYTLWFIYKKGKATAEQIRTFLTQLDNQNPKAKVPTSRRSVYKILSDLKEERLIQYSRPVKTRAFYARLKRGMPPNQARRQRKAGEYSLTEAGKRKAIFWDITRFIAKYFRKHPEIPAVLMFHRDEHRKPTFVVASLQFSDPKEIQIIDRAVRYSEEHPIDFNRQLAEAQRLSILAYCLSLISPELNDMSEASTRALAVGIPKKWKETLFGKAFPIAEELAEEPEETDDPTVLAKRQKMKHIHQAETTLSKAQTGYIRTPIVGVKVVKCPKVPGENNYVEFQHCKKCVSRKELNCTSEPFILHKCPFCGKTARDSSELEKHRQVCQSRPEWDKKIEQEWRARTNQ